MQLPYFHALAAAADDAWRAVRGIDKVRFAAPAPADLIGAENFVPGGVSAEIIFVHQEHVAVFACCNGEMRNGSWLVGQNHDTAGTEVSIGDVQAVLVARSKQVEDRV